jgi:tetratricopeptide (TPR) repeat protein
MTLRFLFLVLLAGSQVTSLLAQGLGSAAAAEPSLKEKVDSLLNQASDLQNRKRYFDALLKLDEAEKLKPDEASIYNVRGAIYLARQLRNVTKSQEQFEIAKRLKPDELPPYFNLAEVLYVSHEWDKAEEALQGVEQKFPKVELGVLHLIVFKRIVCLVRLNRIPEAEALAKKHFTFLDDTPAHYFSASVIAFGKDDPVKGNEWILRAGQIYKKPEMAAYLDSLFEADYLTEADIN